VTQKDQIQSIIQGYNRAVTPDDIHRIINDPQGPTQATIGRRCRELAESGVIRAVKRQSVNGRDIAAYMPLYGVVEIPIDDCIDEDVIEQHKRSIKWRQNTQYEGPCQKCGSWWQRDGKCNRGCDDA
jgi:hypothetical protein